MPDVGPWRGLALGEAHIQQPLACFVCCTIAKIKPDRAALAWGKIECGQLTRPPWLAIAQQFPRTSQIIEARKITLAGDTKQTVSAIQRLDLHRLSQVLQLGHRRVRRAVGPDKAVGTEVGIVRCVAEVAAIGPVGDAIGTLLANPMVDPLPHKAALELWVALKGCEVVGQTAVAIAHGVRELAQDQRPVVCARLGPGDDRLDWCVHRADDVGRQVSTAPIKAGWSANGTFVVERTRRIHATYVARRCIVVWAVAALVTQRPGNHAGVVFVALNHRLDAGHKCCSVA